MDPLAYNYNAHRSVDNGRCKYHNHVTIDSIRIFNISDTDENGVEWDEPFSWWDLTFDVYVGSDLLYESDVFNVNFSMLDNDVFIDFSDRMELRMMNGKILDTGLCFMIMMILFWYQ